MGGQSTLGAFAAAAKRGPSKRPQPVEARGRLPPSLRCPQARSPDPTPATATATGRAAFLSGPCGRLASLQTGPAPLFSPFPSQPSRVKH